MYITAVLGNVRTQLSLRKLKPNNKEMNYAIYGTGPYSMAEREMSDISMKLKFFISLETQFT